MLIFHCTIHSIRLHHSLPCTLHIASCYTPSSINTPPFSVCNTYSISNANTTRNVASDGGVSREDNITPNPSLTASRIQNTRCQLFHNYVCALYPGCVWGSTCGLRTPLVTARKEMSLSITLNNYSVPTQFIYICLKKSNISTQWTQSDLRLSFAEHPHITPLPPLLLVTKWQRNVDHTHMGPAFCSFCFLQVSLITRWNLRVYSVYCTPSRWSASEHTSVWNIRAVDYIRGSVDYIRGSL